MNHRLSHTIAATCRGAGSYWRGNDGSSTAGTSVMVMCVWMIVVMVMVMTFSVVFVVGCHGVFPNKFHRLHNLKLL